MIGSILSGIMTGAAAIHNTVDTAMTNRQNMKINKYNRDWEKYLLGLQQNFAANQAELADQRTRNLYLDLQSPEAIKKQLEDANMSVGMMYGQGGMGGSMQSGAQSPSPSASIGGTIPMQKMFDVQIAQMVANAAKTAAETENIKSDTENKNKDLSVKDQSIKESKERIEKIKQEIEESAANVDVLVEEKMNKIAQRGNIEQDTKLKEEQQNLYNAQTLYQQALTNLTNIQIEWEGKISAAKVRELEASARNLNANAKYIGLQTEVLDEQKEDIIKKMAAERATAEFQANKMNNAEYEKIMTMINTLDVQNTPAKYVQHWFDGTGTWFEQYKGMIHWLVTDVFKISTSHSSVSVEK